MRRFAKSPTFNLASKHNVKPGRYPLARYLDDTGEPDALSIFA